MLEFFVGMVLATGRWNIIEAFHFSSRQIICNYTHSVDAISLPSPTLSDQAAVAMYVFQKSWTGGDRRFVASSDFDFPRGDPQSASRSRWLSRALVSAAS
jgi:hypothetical protein